MRMIPLSAILEYLEELAPLDQAAEWDNVGLLLGDRDAPIQQIMTCLTVTPESASEAVAENAQLIVTHHPILFRPIQRMTSATVEGRMLLGLAKAGVAVYSPHTAFDNAAGGINNLLAQKLGLKDVAVLRGRAEPSKFKIVVFVPETDLARVSDALFAAGAGEIGQYSQCSFRIAGTGTFFGSAAANPTVGQKGRREDVAEWRLEVVCPAEKIEGAIAALRKAHSYEEPAFDVFPLRSLTPRPSPGVPGVGSQRPAAVVPGEMSERPAAAPPGKAKATLGEGRIGRLARAQSLAELVQNVKSILCAGPVQVIGEMDRQVETVAIACGAGGEFLHDAVRAKADVLLTGEARFHDYLAAQAAGLALVLPGHYATERFGVETLAERLQSRWLELSVWASRREGDPVGWV
jgi:dinuclear metal center YbgI/SA1388 family protein